MYLSQPQLAVEIVAYQTTAVMSAELLRMLYGIADGVHSRYARTLDPDDYRQECLMLFLRKADRVKVDRSAFNYLTTAYINLARHMYRTENRYNDIRKGVTERAGIRF